MSLRKLPQHVISLTLIASFLVGCCAPAIVPPRAGPPTYSAVLRTYPKGVALCKTVASIEGVGKGEGNWLLKDHVEIRDSKTLVKCYGTKLTVNVSITAGGKTYEPVAKLTVDKDLNWIQVSSWD